MRANHLKAPPRELASPSLPPLVLQELPVRHGKQLLEALGEAGRLLPDILLVGIPQPDGSEVWALSVENGAYFLPLRQGALEVPEVRAVLAQVGKVLAVETGEPWGVAWGRLETYLEQAAEEGEGHGAWEHLAALQQDPSPERAEPLAEALERMDWNPDLARLYARGLRRATQPARLPEALDPPPPSLSWGSGFALLQGEDWEEQEWEVLPAIVVLESKDPFARLLWELLNENYQLGQEVGAFALAGLWRVGSAEEAKTLGQSLAYALRALDWLREAWGEEEDPDWPEERDWRGRRPQLAPPARGQGVKKGKRSSLLEVVVEPPPPWPEEEEEALLD